MRREQSLPLDVPRERAAIACREAVLTLGWTIPEMTETRIVVRKPHIAGFTAWTEVEILLSSHGERTQLQLNGKLPGLGWPWERTKLNAEMNQLCNAVELAARNRPGPSEGSASG